MMNTKSWICFQVFKKMVQQTRNGISSNVFSLFFMVSYKSSPGKLNIIWFSWYHILIALANWTLYDLVSWFYLPCSQKRCMDTLAVHLGHLESLDCLDGWLGTFTLKDTSTSFSFFCVYFIDLFYFHLLRLE